MATTRTRSAEREADIAVLREQIKKLEGRDTPTRSRRTAKEPTNEIAELHYDCWLYMRRRNPRKALEHARAIVVCREPGLLVDVALTYVYGFDHAFGSLPVKRGPNPALGLRWLREASRAGCTEAMYYLGKVYDAGGPIPRNERRAFEWTLRAAEAGDVDAMVSVGVSYKYARGVEHDAKQMVRWYKKAAEHRSPEALCNLARCYLDGDGVRRDPKRHFELLSEAAEEGWPTAKFQLAEAYLDGEGVKRDTRRGLELLRNSTDRGWWRARRMLASRLLAGDGVPQDVKRAVQLLKSGAKHGDDEALRLLGDHYHDLDGDRGVERALDCYRRAAEMGNASAMVDLHECYTCGHPPILECDDRAAVRWLRRAVELDHDFALYVLADRMLEGRGVRQDVPGAIVLLHQAAVRDEGAAYAALAELALAGKGMKRDVAQALAWFQEAEKRGAEVGERLRACREHARGRASYRGKRARSGVSPTNAKRSGA